MSKEVAVIDSSKELEEMARSELVGSLVLPKVVIGQGSTKKGKIGHFNYESGESFERLSKVTMISIHPSRVLFRGRNAKNKSAACASDNGKVPAARIQHPISKGCLICPAGQWSSGDTYEDEENSKMKAKIANDLGYPQFDSYKPLCTYMENVAFLDQNGMPFDLQLSKHNLKVLEKLKMLGQSMTLKKRVPAIALQFDIWLTPMEGEGNRYLLNFSKSDDWSVVDLSGDSLKDRAFLASVLKNEAPAIAAAKHAAQDEANQWEAAEEVVDGSDVPF